jgi:hypothetical protein
MITQNQFPFDKKPNNLGLTFTLLSFLIVGCAVSYFHKTKTDKDTAAKF